MIGRLYDLVGGMKRRIALSAAVLFAATCALAVWSSQSAASGAGISKVRLGGDQTSTRVVVELDRSVQGKLMDSERGRVVVALPGVGVDGDLSGKGTGLVREWTVDRAGGSARVKLILTRQAAVKRRFLLPPGDGVKVYRYVIDLEAGPGAKPIEAPERPAAEARAFTPAFVSRPPEHKGPRIIVIDAGHGGSDPGASGSDVREKAVTLAAAQALKTRLEKSGRYKVILTRSSDVYIPLEARVGVARQAGADLFISLHADAGPTPSLRGASVYTLSERGQDRAAKKVLRRDDWFSNVALPGRDPVVDRILLDLTQRSTRNRSASFAKVLLDRLDDRTFLLQRSHRDAGFVVLLAPDVPAVLLEMGFITNPDDEAALLDPKRRGRLMDGVAQAVDDYFFGDKGARIVAAVP